MKNNVSTIIENTQDEINFNEHLENLINKVIIKVLEYENFDDNVEVSISLVNNKEIKKINNEFRNIDKATDVLSFPMLEFENGKRVMDIYSVGDYDYEEDELVLGDIIISLERAESQAKEYGHSFERELGFLTAHSMFHLLGYDHMDETEAKIMRKKEEEVLQQLELIR